MAGTPIVDKAFETGTIDSHACGSSQILLDHLYFAESPAPRDVDKLILPTLALKVELYLRQSGVTAGKLGRLQAPVAVPIGPFSLQLTPKPDQ